MDQLILPIRYYTSLINEDLPTPQVFLTPPQANLLLRDPHGSLKGLLDKQKEGVETLSTTERLSKAVYVFNFIKNSFMEPNPPIVQHFSNTSQPQLKERPPGLIKDPETSRILGLFPLIIWGWNTLVSPQVEDLGGPLHKASNHT